MKTEYLKSLGITDQATIDAIMAENGRDINAAKGDLDAQKEKVKTLEKDMADKEKEIQVLKDNAMNNDAIKQELDDLKAAKTKADTDHANELNLLKKSHLVENGLRDARAKSVKAVIPFLDMEKITLDENGGLSGLTEQVEALVKAEKTSFLFEAEPSPSGLTPQPASPGDKGQQPTGLTFRQAIENALAKE